VIYTFYARGFSYRLTFFFNDTATTEIYTLSLHDALPISVPLQPSVDNGLELHMVNFVEAIRKKDKSIINAPIEAGSHIATISQRSEEHTSELQSRENLVCRLLLEKKKQKNKNITSESQHT